MCHVSEKISGSLLAPNSHNVRAVCLKLGTHIQGESYHREFQGCLVQKYCEVQWDVLYQFHMGSEFALDMPMNHW